MTREMTLRTGISGTATCAGCTQAVKGING
jgi:hypothetical protein